MQVLTTARVRGSCQTRAEWLAPELDATSEAVKRLNWVDLSQLGRPLTR